MQKRPIMLLHGRDMSKPRMRKMPGACSRGYSAPGGGVDPRHRTTHPSQYGAPMKIGYARVSTREQAASLATQREALTAAGCKRVYI